MISSTNLIQIPVELFVAVVMFLMTGLLGAVTYLFKQVVALGIILSALKEQGDDHERRLNQLEARRAPQWSPKPRRDAPGRSVQD